jgi:hypothetical protein
MWKGLTYGLYLREICNAYFLYRRLEVLAMDWNRFAVAFKLSSTASLALERLARSTMYFIKSILSPKKCIGRFKIEL